MANLPEAVERILPFVGDMTYGYVNGTGNYHPNNGKDVPWTRHYKTGQTGSDCAGAAICFAHKLKRHRPGFAVGPGSKVSNDINQDSALYDAAHKQDLFEIIDRPEVGALLMFPSVYNTYGKKIKSGHVEIITSVGGILEWPILIPVIDDGIQFWCPNWALVESCGARGPHGRRPCIVRTQAALFHAHDRKWLRKPAMQTRILRVKVR